MFVFSACRQKMKLLEYEGKVKPSNLDTQHSLLAKTSLQLQDNSAAANIKIQVMYTH